MIAVKRQVSSSSAIFMTRVSLETEHHAGANVALEWSNEREMNRFGKVCLVNDH